MPASDADQLIERAVQPRCVRGLDEWRLREHAQPDHGPRPGRRVVRIASGRAPQNLASGIRKRAGKCLLDSDKSGVDELLDFRRVEREHRSRVACRQRERSRPFSTWASSRAAVSLILTSCSLTVGWARKSVVFLSAVPNHVPSSSAMFRSLLSMAEAGAPPAVAPESDAPGCGGR
jgi:hypothetical protein